VADDRNLKQLSPIESVRLRPANIFGTNDLDGEIHGISEVIVNSCDEAGEGYGKVIEITIERDNTVTVRDEGRGLPMGWNEAEGKFNWEIALCTLYGSGKYDSNQYQRAAGLNGLGLTAMQFASEYMEVTSVYDGKAHHMKFKEGVPQGQMKEWDDNSGKTGTTTKFKPDPKVFIDADKTIPPNAFNDLLRKQAMIIEGLKIILHHCDCENPIVMQFNRGIVDFIDAVSESKMVAETAYYEGSAEGTDDVRINPEPYRLDMRFAFNFNKDGGLFEVYHNGVHMYEAVKNKTVEAVQKGFIQAFTELGRNESKLTKSESFVYKDMEQLLVCIAETKAPGYRTFFKNQTKGAINNPFIVKELQQFVTRSLRSWIENNKKEALKAVDAMVTIKKAREEAEKVSKKAIAKITKKNTFLDHAEGLYDCEYTDPKLCEIYIVEGKSALGSVITARDSKTQAGIALTGKPINCVKNNNLSILMNNKVVVNIYRTLQCGIEAKSKYIKDLPPFDINNLRYDKIILAADADIDGKHIIILVIAMFYVLSPTLLKQHKVYIAESPLYEFVYKGQSVFAYSDEERDKIKAEMKQHGVKEGQYEIHRSKGLGENDAEMMYKTTMSKEDRRLIAVDFPEDPEDQKMLASLFEAVLGNDIEARRELIDQYFSITADLEE
jgi:DNA gyrase subunit B domain protein